MWILQALILTAAAVIVYLIIGFWLSLKAAPLSWMELHDQAVKLQRGEKLQRIVLHPDGRTEVNDTAGICWGNIPLFVFFWPWPAAAQLWRTLTGKYPAWAPMV